MLRYWEGPEGHDIGLQWYVVQTQECHSWTHGWARRTNWEQIGVNDLWLGEGTQLLTLRSSFL